MDCEEWRKETKLDELVPTWDYPEKPDVFKYYPQYYHKTDKVRFFPLDACFPSFSHVVSRVAHGCLYNPSLCARRP